MLSPGTPSRRCSFLAACKAAWQQGSRQLLQALAIGQVLSFLLCIMGVTSGLLADRGINMPTTQAWLNYCLLALTCGPLHVFLHWRRCKQHQKQMSQEQEQDPQQHASLLPESQLAAHNMAATKQQLHASSQALISTAKPLLLTNPWYLYALLAFLDVEANFLVTKAYQYTSVTSITLLDCFSVPAVMLLAVLVFRACYQRLHYAGAVLCLAGVTLLVLTDQGSSTGGARPLIGDTLVICGALVYAVCNVGQERLLVEASPIELLAMLGTCGSVVGGVQVAVLERGAWEAAPWRAAGGVSTLWGPLIGFALALYTFYLLVPQVLVLSSSTVLNLSLLTSDLWAAGARVSFFGGFGGTALYFTIAVLLEAAGIVCYAMGGETHRHVSSGKSSRLQQAQQQVHAQQGGRLRRMGGSGAAGARGLGSADGDVEMVGSDEDDGGDLEGVGLLLGPDRAKLGASANAAARGLMAAGVGHSTVLPPPLSPPSAVGRGTYQQLPGTPAELQPQLQPGTAALHHPFSHQPPHQHLYGMELVTSRSNSTITSEVEMEPQVQQQQQHLQSPPTGGMRMSMHSGSSSNSSGGSGSAAAGQAQRRPLLGAVGE